MTYEEIKGYAPVNNIVSDKVSALAESIKTNGYIGAPILVASVSGVLITGSHRLAALEKLENDGEIDVWSMDVAEDVQDIIDTWCEENDASIDDIDFGNLGRVFSGTRIEQYREEIVEW